MNTRLYVGNLSYDTTDDSLREAFEQIGPVRDATVITDRYSGRSRGFGFVEMDNEQAAADAVAQLNETVLDGRTIRVAEASPRPSGGERRDDRSGSYDRW
jgi:RNA recognition motif-containing protein